MNPKYKMHEIVDYQEWAKHFFAIKKPNLVQSWNYGNAKMHSQKWKLMRGIIYENEQPIALVQVYYKKIFFIKLVRLSYGPLWLIEDPTFEQIQGTFNVIKRKWNLRTFSMISLAPNLENLPNNNEILASLGFYKRKCTPYESGLIDLTQTGPDLRANLRQNWRNQLKSSEKKELTFKVSQTYSDFQWLITCFDHFRKEKKFYGHSISLLEALYTHSSEPHETWVAFVSQHTERVAGMLIASYGRACTPLIIWVNSKGRSLNAGNFLLWNGILHAKEKGILWFDLGGTNNSTKFKKGLPHQDYQLVGEYFGFI